MTTDSLKILILEDSDTDAELIKWLLKKDNPNHLFRVMMTRDEFIISLNEFRPDVVLSDNAMPQFSALEALEIVKLQAPHLPFILVTGTVSEEFAVNILKAGADDYLLKDRLTRLPGAIQTAISKRLVEKENLAAAESLRQSEERYRSMMSRVTDGFVAVDNNGYYTYVNKKAADIFNLTPADMLGKNIWDVFPGAKELPFYKAFYEALEKQQYVHVENYYPEFSLWLENHMYPSPEGVSLFFRDITQRKKDEEIARQSEEKYRLLIERMSDCFIELDSDFCYRYLNKRYAELARMTPEELIGKNIWDVFPHAVGSEGYDVYHRVIKEQVYLWHTTYSPGVQLWHEDHVYPSGNGGIFAFVRDITEKKLAEDKLIQRERRFRALVENNEGIISLLDKDLRIIYSSASATRITGWPVDETDKIYSSEYVHPDDVSLMQDCFAKCKDNPGEAIAITMRVQHKNGQYIWLEGVLTNMLNDDAIGGIISNMRNITARKNAEDKLAEQQAKLQTIIDNLPGAMLFQMVGHGNGKVKLNYVSNGVTKLTGLSPEEVLKNPAVLYQFVLPEDLPALKAAHLRALKSMQVLNIEVRCTALNAEIRWLNIISTPRLSDDGTVVWDGFHIDITDRKRADEAIKVANERFELLALATNDVIWDWDFSTGKLWWNNSYHKLFGFENDPPPDIDSWRAYIHPDDRARIAASVESAISSGERFWNDEYKLMIYSGTAAFVYDRGFILRDDNGKAYRMIGAMLDFTERKKSEEAIRVSEEKYRTLVEQASDGIFIADASGRFVMVNSSGCNISGYTEGELSDKTIYDLVDPASLQDHPFRFEEMKRPQGASSQRKIVCKDGTVLDVEISAKFLSDHRFIAFIRDVSDRLKAEAAIVASEERYRVLVEEMSEGIFISDQNGCFTTVNASACKISQYSEAELMEMNIYDFFTEEELRERPIQFEGLRAGKTIVSERVMKRKDGGLNLLEITSKLLTDGRLLSLVRDISERKMAEEALMASEEKYRSLVEQASDAIFIADTAGRFVTVNSSACKLSQYTEAELLQMNIYDFAVEEDLKKRAFRFDELRQGKTTITERVMKANNGGFMHVEITSKLLSDGRLLSFVRDISERMKAQQEIKNTSEQLRRLTAHLQDVREEERKRIGREIHDELGQQLTAIKMDVSWINKQMPEESNVIKGKLKNVIGLLDSSNQSIRRILSELRPNILDDHGLMEALEWLSRQFTESTGIEIIFNRPVDAIRLPEPISTGIFRMYQEALTNITKYAAAKKVTTVVQLVDQEIQLTITDDGKGFDVNMAKSKKSFGLLGMKERVLLLNGQFQLTSSPGSGTTIFIAIPLTIE